MAAYDLEEQEQLAEIKAWWKMYGNLVTGVLTALAIVVVGWQGWQWYQRSQATQASAIFAVLDDAVAARADDLGEETRPLGVGEVDVVEPGELTAEVGEQVILGV